MALFGKKETKKEEVRATAPAGVSTARDLSHVLQHARITEKATMHSEAGVYTFNVADRATKRDIKQAVFALYKVTPRLVRILTIPTKVRRNAKTGKVGEKSGGKKAYVYLKKGETITIS
ncbi:MAG: 50S ribosomal protein L23 [bacterium]|nr:50S ribosomal protein L23 [bacterium]